MYNIERFHLLLAEETDLISIAYFRRFCQISMHRDELKIFAKRLDKEARVWYNTNNHKIDNVHVTYKQAPRSGNFWGLFIYWACRYLVSVKPLGYVVINYTTHNRDYKIDNKFHVSTSSLRKRPTL